MLFLFIIAWRKHMICEISKNMFILSDRIKLKCAFESNWFKLFFVDWSLTLLWIPEKVARPIGCGNQKPSKTAPPKTCSQLRQEEDKICEDACKMENYELGHCYSFSFGFPVYLPKASMIIVQKEKIVYSNKIFWIRYVLSRKSREHYIIIIIFWNYYYYLFLLLFYL